MTQRPYCCFPYYADAEDYQVHNRSIIVSTKKSIMVYAINLADVVKRFSSYKVSQSCMKPSIDD